MSREKSSRYLLKLLTSSTHTLTSEVTHRKLLVMRLRKLVARSILEPMAVLDQCFYSEVLSSPEKIQIAEKLAEEVWRLCSRILNEPDIKLEQLWSWVVGGEDSLEETDMLPSMLIHDDQGMFNVLHDA